MMVQTIRLGHVLRETVSSPTRDLVTRPTGAAVRTRIRDEMARSSCRTMALDFSDVRLLDFSCADEIVAKLLVTVPETECYVVLQGLREDHVEAIDHVLTRQALAVAALPAEGGPPGVVGRVSADARAALVGVGRFGGGDPMRLAPLLGWSEDRTADALQLLALLRLVHVADGTCHPLTRS